MRFAATICLLIISFSVFAQQPNASKADLEKRRQAIIESIKETQAQLEITKQDKKATLTQLRALQAKLDARQRLIGNINEEIGQIDNTIHTSSNEVTSLQGRLEMLKARYAQSLRYAYRNRNSYNMLAFLFSSADFNEAVRRMKYLKRYRDYRKEQADEIRYTQGQIKQKITVLNTQKTQKSMLLSAEEQQKQTLQQETNQTNAVAKELKGREKELASEIQKNEKSKREVEHAISRVIQREIELARKKAEEEARKKAEEERRQEQQRQAAAAAANKGNNGVKLNTGSGMRGESGNTSTGNSHTATTPNNNNAGTAVASNVPPPRHKPTEDVSYKMMLTPEATALSNGFQANQGRLPWPVEKGFISAHFGKQQSPLAEKVYIDNQGIKITVPAGSTARAVYDGVVTGVVYVAGKQLVMINHGDYYSVYMGLSSVNVAKDQKVHAKQVIGTIGQNDDGATELDFQIWKVNAKGQSTRVNPEGWIAH
ncbi:murein hydrolase activator EnvC family protein [Taibaiella soli]|uniref:M23ase beta-sheet core domain-containing protein n=1 Tax=Taibaiella soli TaxID=1649169 RepID=A0A2W2AIT7_9BACT|nr:peptidoglycan DD-metalloendopeptidase family protein [Taibaiella soli]PZF72150.1 hypothetical protein DN068_14540 [Taibaiella soli]